MDYLTVQENNYFELRTIEGYDFGIAVPSCYLIAQCDAWGNVFLIDGFYKRGEDMPVEEQRDEIKRLRDSYGISGSAPIFADPSIFRRTNASNRTIGNSTADILWDGGRGVRLIRGNNDIVNGIIKVSAYLAPMRMHPHPLTGEHGAPHLYVADTLEFVSDEFGTYRWKKNGRGDVEDVPVDKDDHAMDTIKYLLSRRPEIAKLPNYAIPKPPSYMTWRTRDVEEKKSVNNHRRR
jgi:hypothetical protein